MAEACHAGGQATVATAEAALHVALAGNPNVGKSSLFNRLTGARQHVGNWPGKTVERRTGTCRRQAADGPVEVALVDLPGTYSLAASSPEEVVAEQALTGGEVDVVATVLDSTNLERNLYLAAQVAELGLPQVLVLNLTDAARSDGGPGRRRAARRRVRGPGRADRCTDGGGDRRAAGALGDRGAADRPGRLRACAGGRARGSRRSSRRSRRPSAACPPPGGSRCVCWRAMRRPGPASPLCPAGTRSSRPRRPPSAGCEPSRAWTPPCWWRTVVTPGRTTSPRR
jgi:hypothetical protein